MHSLNLYLFIHINDLAGHSRAADFFGIFCAEYLLYLLGMILFLLLIYPKKDRKSNRIMVAVSVTAALIARCIVKEAIIAFYRHPRPYIVLSDVHKLISMMVADNYQSLPSGHAIFCFALATTLFCFSKKIGSWFFLAAIVIGVARIYVGVHWPSDIVCGAILGMLTGWITYRTYRHFKRTLDSWVSKLFLALGEL